MENVWVIKYNYVCMRSFIKNTQYIQSRWQHYYRQDIFNNHYNSLNYLTLSCSYSFMFYNNTSHVFM